MTRIVIHGVGAFEVSPLPGQPQVAHCHALFVPPPAPWQRLGQSA